MNRADPTVVIVPGLRDHVADHWQTHLGAALDNSVTVAPLERDKLSRRARVAALDEVLQRVHGPVVLVAHSAGVITTVHWAQHPTREIAGALLVTPADLELPLPAGYPSTEELDCGGWNPIRIRTLGPRAAAHVRTPRERLRAEVGVITHRLRPAAPR
ncbi:alpha/beta hydrolase [Gordonia sp. HNM0687]|uniref:Alpha/beta hydrolase n=1 Tax=Gordonia mangrovi TaxID=2665643 RepID=A0A6L7GPB1_9ACTN|nr:alpha/beta hydrolase [Gordonia mangrovi]